MNAREQAGIAGVEEIERLFQGRRRAARTACMRLIEVTGSRASYRAKTINVSRLGALVEIHDPRFLPAGSAGSLMEVAAAARRAFPRALRIRFRLARVAVNASVVRVAGHPTSEVSALGCAFEAALTRRQCRAIGIAYDVMGEHAPAADEESRAVDR